MARLRAELPNLRTALVWLDERGDGASLLRLAAALARFWCVQGLLREGTEWLERAVAAAENRPAAIRAKALVGLGMTALFRGDYEQSVGCLDEGLALCRRAGDAPPP